MPAFIVTVLTFGTLVVCGFAQSDGATQAIENAGQSSNQTGEGMQQGADNAASSAGQSANQTSEGMPQGASDVGSKITEGAKDLLEALVKNYKI